MNLETVILNGSKLVFSAALCFLLLAACSKEEPTAAVEPVVDEPAVDAAVEDVVDSVTEAADETLEVVEE